MLYAITLHRNELGDEDKSYTEEDLGPHVTLDNLTSEDWQIMLPLIFKSSTPPCVLISKMETPGAGAESAE